MKMGTCLFLRYRPCRLSRSGGKNKHVPIFHAARVTGGVLLLAAVAASSADLEIQLKTCARLRDDSERLACYDRTVARLYSGEDADGPDADADGEPSAEAMFGMSRQVDGPAEVDREAIPSISAQVKSLQKAADGTLLIELDNGQLWRQVDSKDLLLRAGDRVTISRGALDSFRIATPGNRHGRVRRLR
jgi:hypothetical protein